MAAVSAPPRGIPHVLDFREPERLRRIPVWASTAALLVFLTAVSAYLRTHFITGQFWEDEAITTGIASHSLSAIPGVLRHDGSPPLFYLLLHVWISIFGTSEAATHSLSLAVRAAVASRRGCGPPGACSGGAPGLTWRFCARSARS